MLRHVAGLEAIQHLLEKHTLVRRVLVHEHESAITLEHDVESAHDADEPERDTQERRGFQRGARGRGGWGSDQ